MYNKLFSKIVHSSVWMESLPTRIVWITFLALMDRDGFVALASVANVAHQARVSLEEASDAVGRLEGPDQESSDPEHHGRRVERVPGGWIVLNATKHHNLVSAAISRESTRLRVERYRRAKTVTAEIPPVTEKSAHVTDPLPTRTSNAVQTQTTDPTTADQKLLAFPAEKALVKRRGRPIKADEAVYTPDFLTFWKAYPLRVKKADAWVAWQKYDPPITACLATIAWQVQSREWQEGAIPHPTTWLNGQRWEDEPPDRAPVQAGFLGASASSREGRILAAADRTVARIEGGEL